MSTWLYGYRLWTDASLVCALIDSETMQPTTIKPIPYECCGSGLCDRPLKTAKNHILIFGASSPRSYPELLYQYHNKAQLP